MIIELSAEGQELLNAAKAAGWDVAGGRTGFRVDTGKGVVIIKPGDPDSVDKARERLARLGLGDVQRRTGTTFGEAVRVAEERSAVPLAHDDRQAKHAAALVRAAGDYLTEPVDMPISWYITAHPAPQMRRVRITPGIASVLLRDYNQDNRNPSPWRVQHYKRIFLKGLWRFTHQGWAIDTRPMVQDCQHRLMALEEAGAENPDVWADAAFWVGMPPENFDVIDEGFNRSPAHILGREGVKSATIVAACCRLVLALEDQAPRVRVREKGVNAETVAKYHTDPERFQLAARYAAKSYRHVGCSSGALSAAYYAITKANGSEEDNRYVRAFFGGLRHPDRLKFGTRIAQNDDDPRRVVRRYFTKQATTGAEVRPLEATARIIIAWNHTVEGYSPYSVRFDESADIPQPTICKDPGGDRAAATAPPALRGEIPTEEEQ